MDNTFYQFLLNQLIFARIERGASNNSNRLTLSDLNIKSIPKALRRRNELHSINLNNNEIRDDWFNLPSSLYCLAICYNGLSQVPPAVSMLKHLRVLNISNNPLVDGLGTDICTISTLDTLWCNNCQLNSLPEEISQLINLRTFGARHNKLRSLPEGICKLRKLEWLTLEDNQLLDVPSGFSQLQSLLRCNFKSNSFTCIPKSMWWLGALRLLLLQHNSLVDVSFTDFVTNDRARNTLIVHLEGNPIASINVKTPPYIRLHLPVNVVSDESIENEGDNYNAVTSDTHIDQQPTNSVDQALSESEDETIIDEYMRNNDSYSMEEEFEDERSYDGDEDDDEEEEEESDMEEDGEEENDDNMEDDEYDDMFMTKLCRFVVAFF